MRSATRHLALHEREHEPDELVDSRVAQRAAVHALQIVDELATQSLIRRILCRDLETYVAVLDQTIRYRDSHESPDVSQARVEIILDYLVDMLLFHL